MRTIHWFNSFLFSILAGVCLKQVYEIATHLTTYNSNTFAIVIFSVLTLMSLFMSSINFIMGVQRFDPEINNV